MAPASLHLIPVHRPAHPPALPPASSMPPPAGAAPGDTRVSFGRAPVDSLSMQQASAWLLAELESASPAAGNTPHLIMGPNAFLVTLAKHNDRFAQALARASLCLPDGMSVVWGARLLGRFIPERVTGGEFMERMCALMAPRGKSVYFLGGLPQAAHKAAQALAARYPGLVIAGTDCPPQSFERDSAANEAVLARIRAARPDLLFVALGAPRQEIWMLDHCLELPIGAALSVGAAFDTQAGFRKRAPAWTHAVGAEWLYRLALEPRRLWKRYLVGNASFARVILEEWISQRKHAATIRLLKVTAPTPRPSQQPERPALSLLPSSRAQSEAVGD